MPYIIEVVQAGRTVEVMKYYSSRYGKKGIKRGERKALTKEEQIKVNKRAAEKKLRRLINENFQEGDTHLVLDYRKERRPAGRKPSDPGRCTGAKKSLTARVRGVKLSEG